MGSRKVLAHLNLCDVYLSLLFVGTNYKILVIRPVFIRSVGYVKTGAENLVERKRRKRSNKHMANLLLEVLF